MSMMLINPMGPQPVWGGPLPSDNLIASGSHFRDNIDWEFLYRHFIDCPCSLSRFWSGAVSQRQLLPRMDNKQWFQQMAGDSGDEAYMGEDFYSDCFPTPDMGAPYARAQTTAGGVSAVNVGRDFGPSHIQQHNKELPAVGNEQMFLTNIPTANGYSRGFGSNYDAQQSSWQTYDTTGNITGGTGYLNLTDGMPNNNNWHQPNLPVFGEPLEGNQVSPSSFSSSARSSATSDAMAAMTLDSMALHGNTTGHPRASSSVSGSDNSGSTWASSYPSTISPKMLRLHPSPTSTPTPASPSESIPANMIPSGDSDLSSSAFDNHRHAFNPVQSQRLSQKPRKELPDKPTRSRPAPAASHSEPPSSSRGKESPVIPPPRPSPQRQRQRQQPSQKTRVAQLRQESQNNVAHEAVTVEESPSPPTTPTRSSTVPRTMPEGPRSAKDDFLVKSKLAGMTYREIRRKGNFTEAESTLRGRFRTLTKDKEARVRRPEWQDNDIRLLKRAVRKLNQGGDATIVKAPWGQVADYIMNHGGSYQFGSATCHRKWKELVEEGKATLK